MTIPFLYINIFLNVIYSCDCKAEFLASLLQSSVSHYPSEIILIWSRNLKVVQPNIFVETTILISLLLKK